MNYFAHSCVATRFENDPGFVLGAMLPDFAGMIGARIRDLTDARLREGENHHHHADAVFHRAPTFRALILRSTRRLDADGLSRGASRGAAHLGVELVFDGALLGDGSATRGYLDAVDGIAGFADAIRWSRSDGASRFGLLERRLLDAGLPSRPPAAEEVASRVVRVLSRRARLALQPSEEPALLRWLADLRDAAPEWAPPLLAETLDGLGRSGDSTRNA